MKFKQLMYTNVATPPANRCRRRRRRRTRFVRFSTSENCFVKLTGIFNRSRMLNMKLICFRYGRSRIRIRPI